MRRLFLRLPTLLVCLNIVLSSYYPLITPPAALARDIEGENAGSSACTEGEVTNWCVRKECDPGLGQYVCYKEIQRGDCSKYTEIGSPSSESCGESSPQRMVCTPGSYERSMTGRDCGNTEHNCIQEFRQCREDGAGFGGLQEECSNQGYCGPLPTSEPTPTLTPTPVPQIASTSINACDPATDPICASNYYASTIPASTQPADTPQEKFSGGSWGNNDTGKCWNQYNEEVSCADLGEGALRKTRDCVDGKEICDEQQGYYVCMDEYRDPNGKAVYKPGILTTRACGINATIAQAGFCPAKRLDEHYKEECDSSIDRMVKIELWQQPDVDGDPTRCIQETKVGAVTGKSCSFEDKREETSKNPWQICQSLKLPTGCECSPANNAVDIKCNKPAISLEEKLDILREVALNLPPVGLKMLWDGLDDLKKDIDKKQQLDQKKDANHEAFVGLLTMDQRTAILTSSDEEIDSLVAGLMTTKKILQLVESCGDVNKYFVDTPKCDSQTETDKIQTQLTAALKQERDYRNAERQAYDKYQQLEQDAVSVAGGMSGILVGGIFGGGAKAVTTSTVAKGATQTAAKVISQAEKEEAAYFLAQKIKQHGAQLLTQEGREALIKGGTFTREEVEAIVKAKIHQMGAYTSNDAWDKAVFETASGVLEKQGGAAAGAGQAVAQSTAPSASAVEEAAEAAAREAKVLAGGGKAVGSSQAAVQGGSWWDSFMGRLGLSKKTGESVTGSSGGKSKVVVGKKQNVSKPIRTAQEAEAAAKEAIKLSGKENFLASIKKQYYVRKYPLGPTEKIVKEDAEVVKFLKGMWPEKYVNEALKDILPGLVKGVSTKKGLLPFNLIQTVYAQENLPNNAQLVDKDTYEFLVKKNLIKNQLLETGEVDSSYIETVGALELFNPTSEVVDDGFVMTTGKEGIVAGNVQKGTYLLSIEPVQDIDFLIPGKMEILGEETTISVGVKQTGSGKVEKLTARSGQGKGVVYAQEQAEEWGKVTVEVFDDQNGNGKKENGEEILPWAGVKVKLVKETQEREIALHSGWNLITLPTTSTPLTAYQLIQMINSQGGEVVAVSALENGAWKSFVARGDKNYSNVDSDFVIKPAQAYFVKAVKLSVLKMTGQNLTEPIKLNLQRGWNAIGLPVTSKEYTASTLLDELNTQPVSADTVASWDTGLWATLLQKDEQQYGKDFDIESSKGYILKVGKEVEFSP